MLHGSRVCLVWPVRSSASVFQVPVGFLAFEHFCHVSCYVVPFVLAFQHLGHDVVWCNVPSPCLKSLSVDCPSVAHEERVLRVVPVMSTIPARRGRNLPHPVQVLPEVSVSREELGQMEVYFPSPPSPSKIARPLLGVSVRASVAALVLPFSLLVSNIFFRSRAKRSMGITSAITSTAASDTVAVRARDPQGPPSLYRSNLFTVLRYSQRFRPYLGSVQDDRVDTVISSLRTLGLGPFVLAMRRDRAAVLVAALLAASRMYGQKVILVSKVTPRYLVDPAGCTTDVPTIMGIVVSIRLLVR
ncbi:hypothetical protein WN48_11186 [Eufriesea mexicana]|uniref:Uncharacterized protein n=1 Tax=Eufriesea mexicana TaxID=516756 RepID=A0A310SH87_9HYME|nr:hypothetical protein WN48_11186 [Eufriesea mexicana]